MTWSFCGSIILSLFFNFVKEVTWVRSLHHGAISRVPHPRIRGAIGMAVGRHEPLPREDLRVSQVLSDGSEQRVCQWPNHWWCSSRWDWRARRAICQRAPKASQSGEEIRYASSQMPDRFAAAGGSVEEGSGPTPKFVSHSEACVPTGSAQAGDRGGGDQGSEGQAPGADSGGRSGTGQSVRAIGQPKRGGIADLEAWSALMRDVPASGGPGDGGRPGDLGGAGGQQPRCFSGADPQPACTGRATTPTQLLLVPRSWAHRFQPPATLTMRWGSVMISGMVGDVSSTVGQPSPAGRPKTPKPRHSIKEGAGEHRQQLVRA